jgi:hypothetical protein
VSGLIIRSRDIRTYVMSLLKKVLTLGFLTPNPKDLNVPCAQTLALPIENIMLVGLTYGIDCRHFVR